MKLATTLRGGGTASFSFSFFRRRLRSTGSFRGGRASPFFTSIGRKRGAAAADNPEPSSPKVTCIGQVRVKSQKKVKQCRRRIGEASFRSADQSFPPQQQRRRRWRDQRWVHLPNISVVLRAFGDEFCCLFRCRCCCFHRRERVREKSGCSANENGCGTVLGRWLVAASGERRREIEVVVESGDEEMSAGNSRRHVFDDIEVKGDRIEVKGMSLMNVEREATRVSISIPPQNALLLMRCRSDPIKMAAIENRISSDSARYQNSTIQEEEEKEDEDDDDDEEEDEVEDDDDATTTSSDELFEGEFVAQVLEEMHNVEEKGGGEEKLFIYNQEKIEKIELQPLAQEEEEIVKSNESSSEVLLGQENADNYQDCSIQVEAKSEADQNQDSMIVQQGNDDDTVVKNAVASDKSEADMPENQETAAAAARSLPECLLLMMREPKLSMEVSKETWVCATDFIKLLPERPRKAAANKAGGGEHETATRRRAAVEKSSRPRVPAPPSKKNSDVQPARSSCSIERKRVNCEPLALTRCKSEPMSTAAAKLMPEAGCWKDNVEPHRQAALEVGAAGVGF